ncbi:MAG: hypothetical protein ACE5DS_02065 [Kiloniellaceae bacterium]
MSEEPSADAASVASALLNGRYRIHIDRPLPKLDSPLAKAVEADDPRSPGRAMFALVCDPNLIPRLDVTSQLARLVRLPLVVPADAGAIAWPATGGRRFAIVFDVSMGERIVPPGAARFPAWREDRVIREVVTPLIPALRELNSRSLWHRAIRADNLFYADSSRTSVVLGECVSVPPGLSQPVLYEPIDAAIARPAGRGPGRKGDDLYNFGVALVVLLSGGNPVPDLSDEEMIAAKIRVGTYATLVRHLCLSLHMMEILRGLLCDDPRDRWTMSDLELWAGGRHLSPKQPTLPPRAARCIEFAGREYWTRPALCHAMGQSWSDAGQLISSGELENWLRRSLVDEESAASVQTLSAFAGAAPENSDRLVSRALMVLEPTFPIRYRRLSARLEGLPQAFAVEYDDDELRPAFEEVLRAKLPQSLLQSQAGPPAEHGPLMKTFDMMSFFVERSQVGQGLERALYESNRPWPCRSPMIAQDGVNDLESLLPALERFAHRGGTSGEPVDRHIAAFCYAHRKSLSEGIMRDLNKRDTAARRLAMIRLLAEVQRATGPSRRYPSLSAWIAGLLPPIIESFHNRSFRVQLAREVERLAGKGSLVDLEFVMDSLTARSADTNGFAEARREYADLEQGVAWLESGGLVSRDHVVSKSRQAATFVSATLSGLAILILSIAYVF